MRHLSAVQELQKLEEQIADLETVSKDEGLFLKVTPMSTNGAVILDGWVGRAANEPGTRSALVQGALNAMRAERERLRIAAQHELQAALQEVSE